LSYVSKGELDAARALERTAGGTPRAAPLAWFALHPAAPGGRVRRVRVSLGL